MPDIPQSAKAPDFRQKAAMCTGYAACARSDADRSQLLRMRDEWLARAANEDWLDGLPPTPPAGAIAVAVPL